MIRYLLLLMLISTPAIAGIGVCHDGAGNITALNKDANPAAFTGENCVYYAVPNNVTAAKYAEYKALTPRYAKWDGEPVEMTQAEKDSVDAAEAQAAQDAADARWNAMIDKAKARVDSPDTGASLIQECVSLNIIAPEIRAIKSNNPNPTRSDAELKQAVKQCLENKKR